MLQVTKTFDFDAAHFLPNYYGKCEKLHGHTYNLHVTIEGELGENGLLIDFVILKKIVKERVLNQLDHSHLNDLIPVPSAENIAIWIWEQLVDLKSHLKTELEDPNLSESIKKYFKAEEVVKVDASGFSKTLRLAEIKLWETATSIVTYRG